MKSFFLVTATGVTASRMSSEAKQQLADDLISYMSKVKNNTSLKRQFDDSESFGSDESSRDFQPMMSLEDFGRESGESGSEDVPRAVGRVAHHESAS